MPKAFPKKGLLIAGGILLVLAASIFIFINFFLDDTLTSLAIPKFQKIIRYATHGRYEARIKRLAHFDNGIICFGLDLVRQHYDTSERSITVERFQIDTIRCYGVHWWDLLRSEEFEMNTMTMNAPKIYFT